MRKRTKFNKSRGVLIRSFLKTQYRSELLPSPESVTSESALFFFMLLVELDLLLLDKKINIEVATNNFIKIRINS